MQRVQEDIQQKVRTRTGDAPQTTKVLKKCFYYKLTLGRNQTTFRNLEIDNFVLHPLATGSTHSVDKPFPTCSCRGDTIVILWRHHIILQLYLIRPSLPDYYQCMNPSQAQPD